MPLQQFQLIFSTLFCMLYLSKNRHLQGHALHIDILSLWLLNGFGYWVISRVLDKGRASKHRLAGSKVIAKAYPEERVGVFAKENRALKVVEYSELDPKLASAARPGNSELRWQEVYHWEMFMADSNLSGLFTVIVTCACKSDKGNTHLWELQFNHWDILTWCGACQDFTVCF